MPCSRVPGVDAAGRTHNTASSINAYMQTGSHELTVNGYPGTTGLDVGKFRRSAVFSVGGHRWVIKYYPDGYKECADYISVYLELDKTRWSSDDTKVIANISVYLELDKTRWSSDDAFMYTDSVPPINEADMRVMAQHLLVASDRYCLEGLKMICEDVLRSCIDMDTAATTLVLAEQHRCHRLKEGYFNFLKNPGNVKAVMATDGFDHLLSSCPSLVKELPAKVSP